jgi:Tol biopolymer transport system component
MTHGIARSIVGGIQPAEAAHQVSITSTSMTRFPFRLARLVTLLGAIAACVDDPVGPTQSPVVGTTGGGTNPPATTPSTPSNPADPPLVSSPFIVDTGATPGGRIVFAASSDFETGFVQLESMQPDGTGLTSISPSDEMRAGTPAWSPDDALIAYGTYGSRGWIISVMRPDGSGNRPLVEGDSPFWLADGRVGFHCNLTDICAVDTTGANRTVVLRRPADTPDLDFTLSPDGTMIAFVRFRANVRTDRVADDVHYTVWVMRRDGTGARRLTSTDSSVAMELSPRWSRDGRQIAFSSGELGIAVADVDGGRLHSVSRHGEIQPSIGTGSPAWSPDGTKLIFGGENGIFYIANADATGLIRRVRVPMLSGYGARSMSWSSR